jgi:hypothetical protein
MSGGGPASNRTDDRPRFGDPTSALGRRPVQALIACAGLLTVAGGRLYGGLSAGAALTGVLGFLLTTAGLIQGNGTDSPLTEDEPAAQLRRQRCLSQLRDDLRLSPAQGFGARAQFASHLARLLAQGPGVLLGAGRAGGQRGSRAMRTAMPEAGQQGLQNAGQQGRRPAPGQAVSRSCDSTWVSAGVGHSRYPRNTDLVSVTGRLAGRRVQYIPSVSVRHRRVYVKQWPKIAGDGSINLN